MKPWYIVLAVVVAALVAGTAWLVLARTKDAAAPAATAPRIVGTWTLPAIRLAGFQESLFPGASYSPIPVPPNGAAADRLVELGGIGSDLYHVPGASPDEFWMITDRGPNGETAEDFPAYPETKTFVAPWFTPTILHVRTSGKEIEILGAIPLVGTDGKPVGGLPNLGVTSPTDPESSYDDPPLAYNGRPTPAIRYSPAGLDTEAVVRTAAGGFWIADEYSPSIVHISADGRVLERIVPNGLPLTAGYAVTGNPVVDDGKTASPSTAVPAIYQLRKKNRGFEALALSPSGRYLFVGLQSPLQNPDGDAGDASLNTRILRYDLDGRAFTAEYVFRFQPAAEYEEGAESGDLKLSAMAALDDDTLLVEERTDAVAKVYLTELSGATSILGTWDSWGGAKQPAFLGDVTVPRASSATSGDLSLEQQSAGELAGNGIVPAVKERLVFESDESSGLPKIEGVAVLSETLIALSTDNDFGVQAGGEGVAYDKATGNMLLTGVPSQILQIELGRALPKMALK